MKDCHAKYGPPPYNWSGRTIHGSRTWSGGDTIWRKGTIHGAMDGPAGPTVGGTIYGMTGPDPRMWCFNIGFDFLVIALCTIIGIYLSQVNRKLVCRCVSDPIFI